MSKILYDYINSPISKFINTREFKDSLAKVLCCTNTGGGGIQSIVAGTNITIDNTDPLNPIISSTGGITGTGTNNVLTKWTGTTSLGNSLVSEDATTVKIGVVGAQPTYAFGVFGTTNGAVITADQKALDLTAGTFSTIPALTVLRNNTSANIAEFSGPIESVKITPLGSIQASALAGTGTRMVVTTASGVLDYQALPSDAITAASVSDINTGTDNTKFANALALQTSKYLDQSGSKQAILTSGVVNVYTAALSPAITSYTNGQVFYIKFHLANTAASTINFNGLGAKSLVKNASTPLVSGDLILGKIYYISYDGTNFQVLNVGGLISGTGGQAYTTSPALTSPSLTTPTVVTSIIGSATQAVFNTTSTTINAFGAATTMIVGGTPTTAVTHDYSANPTATATTKTISLGKGGVSGSTTAIGIGSSVSGATNNITLNISPATDAAWDMYVRNDSGFLERIANGTTGQVLSATTGAKPAFATPSSSGWGLTGNLGIVAGTNYIGANNSAETWVKNNSLLRAVFGVGSNTIYPTAGSIGGASFFINSGDNANKAYGTVIGSDSNGHGYISQQRADGGGSLYNLALQPLGAGVIIGAQGNALSSTAILQIDSTTKGVLLPRLTTTQINAIASPTKGLTVFNTNLNTLCFFDGTIWQKVTSLPM